MLVHMRIASFIKAAVDQTSDLSFVPKCGVFTGENPDLDDGVQKSFLEMVHKEPGVIENDHYDIVEEGTAGEDCIVDKADVG